MQTGAQFQLRRYAIRTGMQSEAERRLADYVEPDGRLLGSWTTDVGPLNRIVQLWSLEHGNARDSARSLDDLLAEPARIDALIPFTFSPTVPVGTLGPYFELRIYGFQASELQRLSTLWERALPARLSMSPLAGIWYTRRENTFELIHLWPYVSLDERSRIRAAAIASRCWPPSAVAVSPAEAYRVDSQESWIMLPSPFSPMR